MDFFRKNQKHVFYILTPIIILAFVVWGVGDFWGNSSYRSPEVGTVDGKRLSYGEFEAFRKRIQAALGSNINLQFNGAPYAGTPFEELWKYIFTYAVLQDAEKAGARASDLQIGTYLETGHPNIAPNFSGDHSAVEKAVNSLCIRHQITRQDFLQGVREFQTMANYVMDDSNLAVVNDQTVYTLYALARTECVVKRIRIAETDAVREQAKKDVMEKPAEDLEREVRDYAAAKSGDRRYREPSGWRFAYVLVPFAAPTAVRDVSKTEVEEYYEANKGTFEGKPLAEVEEQVKATLRQLEAERLTLRNFTVDVDPQLRGQGNELELSELVKLVQLVKYGVVGGDTGPDALSPSEVLKKLPEGADFTLRARLEALDGLSDGEIKDKLIEEWKNGFLFQIFDTNRPLRSDLGYFRLKLLEYKPSSPMALEDAEGNIKPEILQLAVTDMVGERTTQLIEERSTDMEARLRTLLEAREKGETVADAELAAEYDALPPETLRYGNLVQESSPLATLSIGDLVGPFEYQDAASGAAGRELVVLVDRRVPSREAFAAESDEIKNVTRQNARVPFLGGLSFTYTMRGPTAVVQPSPTIGGSLLNRLLKGEISVNPELMRTGSDER